MRSENGRPGGRSRAASATRAGMLAAYSAPMSGSAVRSYQLSDCGSQVRFVDETGGHATLVVDLTMNAALIITYTDK